MVFSYEEGNHNQIWSFCLYSSNGGNLNKQYYNKEYIADSPVMNSAILNNYVEFRLINKVISFEDFFSTDIDIKADKLEISFIVLKDRIQRFKPLVIDVRNLKIGSKFQEESYLVRGLFLTFMVS